MASTRLRLRVSPGAGESRVVGRHGDAWKLRVAAAPERGKANHETVRALAEALGVGADDVKLVAGHGSRDKLVEIHGLSAGDAERRLGQ